MTNFNFKGVEAIATDIDGTLTKPNYLLSIEAIQSIRELEKIGIKVILISGHVFPTVSALSQYVGTSGPIVAENGCVIGYRWEPILLGDPIEDREKVVKLMIDLGFEEAPTNKFRYIDLAFRRTSRSNLSVETLYDLLEKNGINGIEIHDSGFAVHISPKGLNKGVGLRKALELAKIDPNKTIAIGDGDNDLPFFSVVGFSVAVANASENLKKQANLVLERGNGEGFQELAKMIINAKKKEEY